MATNQWFQSPDTTNTTSNAFLVRDNGRKRLVKIGSETHFIVVSGTQIFSFHLELMINLVIFKFIVRLLITYIHHHDHETNIKKTAKSLHQLVPKIDPPSSSTNFVGRPKKNTPSTCIGKPSGPHPARKILRVDYFFLHSKQIAYICHRINYRLLRFFSKSACFFSSKATVHKSLKSSLEWRL